MTDWLVLLAIFIVVLNPAVTAQVVLGSGLTLPMARLAALLLPGMACTLAVLALAALLSESILDWLSLSLSTFQIATGVLLVLGALQAFVGPGLRSRGAGERAALWLNVALLVWLLSPPPIALAIASAGSEGEGGAIIVAALALAATAGLALTLATLRSNRAALVLVWGARLSAGFAVLAAVDLIRQGVENV